MQNYGDVKALGGYSVTVGGIIGRGHMSIDSNINYGDISSYAYGWATSGGVTGNMYSSPHLQASIKGALIMAISRRNSLQVPKYCLLLVVSQEES